MVLEAPDKPFDFAWPQPEPLRAAGASGSLLQFKGVSYTYPGAPAPVLHVSGVCFGPCVLWPVVVFARPIGLVAGCGWCAEAWQRAVAGV